MAVQVCHPVGWQNRRALLNTVGLQDRDLMLHEYSRVTIRAAVSAASLSRVNFTLASNSAHPPGQIISCAPGTSFPSTPSRILTTLGNASHQQRLLLALPEPVLPFGAGLYVSKVHNQNQNSPTNSPASTIQPSRSIAASVQQYREYGSFISKLLRLPHPSDCDARNRDDSVPCTSRAHGGSHQQSHKPSGQHAPNQHVPLGLWPAYSASMLPGRSILWWSSPYPGVWQPLQRLAKAVNSRVQTGIPIVKMAYDFNRKQRHVSRIRIVRQQAPSSLRCVPIQFRQVNLKLFCHRWYFLSFEHDRSGTPPVTR